jgi:branched-chain amino acid transport system ATP-binding protein
MLVVEQDVATALELADRAFVMDTGRVTRSGTSAALRDDPAIREAYLGAL